MTSILTNTASMIALQSLEATQSNLTQTQNEISTGLAVGSAKDNAATWAVATQMRSNISNMQQVGTNLGSADSVLSTALAGAGQISTLISEIRTKVTSAESPGTDTQLVQNDINQLVQQINSTVASSQFNGVNLLNGSGSQQFVASVNTTTAGASTANYITVGGANLNASSGGGLAALANLSVVNNADGISGSASANTITFGGTAGTASTTAPTNQLSAGDSVSFSYNSLNASTNANQSGTVTFQVVSGTAAAATTDGNGNYTIQVSQSAVSNSTDGSGITATAQAAAFQSAMDAAIGSDSGATATGISNVFTNSSTADTSKLQMKATTGTLSLTLPSASTTGASATFGAVTANYQSLLSTLDSAATLVSNTNTEIGSAQSRVELQETFVSNLNDTLQTGVSTLVDADMTAESARLSALQTQQQLGTQALSIANQAPQSILSLFR